MQKQYGYWAAGIGSVCCCLPAFIVFISVIVGLMSPPIVRHEAMATPQAPTAVVYPAHPSNAFAPVAVVNKPKPALKSKPTGPYMTVLELNQEYDGNSIRADAKYTNKEVRVKGIVQKVGKDILGNPYVAISMDDYNPIQCYVKIADTANLVNLKPGDPIGVTGICKGKSIFVSLDDCTFETR